MTKYKYYVVWEGLAPGIYDSWEECRQQVENVKGAKYKSFDSREAAIKAFRGKPEEHIGLLKQIAGHADKKNETVKQAGQAKLPAAVIPDSLAVDAACSGNPGDMEYRGGIYCHRRRNIQNGSHAARHQQYRRISGHCSRSRTYETTKHLHTVI